MLKLIKLSGEYINVPYHNPSFSVWNIHLITF